MADVRMSTNLIKAISMDDVGRFHEASFHLTHMEGIEVRDKHQASIPKLNDVVWELVSNSESNVFQSCE